MSEADAAIAELDNALAQFGQSVTIRRQTLSGSTVSYFDVPCKAVVSNYQPHQLVEGIIQGDSLAILSPTDLRRGGWPSTSGIGTDDQLVPKRDDKLVVSGRQRNVQAPTPFYIGDTLVRVELQVRG